ncbi:hypothetical protein O2K51_12270 [Apibacter raozihei]|uniref:hypothetical protein n=1 Tax=Apibacter raozihei TaxID=2500547 RepID=UPI000FE2E934|nr:hypothetical protein [Apibacter raozihei]
MKKLLLYQLVVFCLFSNFTNAQRKLLDSLQNIVSDKRIPDKEKIIPLSNMAGMDMSDTARAMKMAKESLKLALKENDPGYIVYSYSSLGTLYAYKKDIHKTYEVIDSIMFYLEKSTDIDKNAFAYLRLGLIKSMVNDKDGIKDIFTSIELFKKMNYKNSHDKKYSDKWHGLALGYNLLSSQYDLTPQYSKKYSQLSLDAALKSKKPTSIYIGYTSLGSKYLSDYQLFKKKAALDSSRYFFEKALDYGDNHDGYIPDILLLISLTNLSNLYNIQNKLSPNDVYADKIEHCLNKAKYLAERNNHINFQVSYYNLLITTEINKKNYLNAIKFTHQILTKTSNIDYLFKENYEFHQLLSELYEEIGDNKSAILNLKKSFEYYKQHFEYKYSFANQELLNKYNVAEKEKEIEIKKTENFWHFIVICILCLLLMVLFFSYKFRIKYLNKKKNEAKLLVQIKEEEAKMLKLEKENVELMACIKEEETNRLQKEVLAKYVQVSHKNELLDSLKRQTTVNPNEYPVLLKKIIKNEEILDKNFDDFKTMLNEIHPEFYHRLQSKANQKLTTLDLKYCIYIFMKMPTKEMADLLHVELKTIRMSKYRLKQKLNLKKEEDLDNFIQNII